MDIRLYPRVGHSGSLATDHGGGNHRKATTMRTGTGREEKAWEAIALLGKRKAQRRMLWLAKNNVQQCNVCEVLCSWLAAAVQMMYDCRNTFAMPAVEYGTLSRLHLYILNPSYFSRVRKYSRGGVEKSGPRRPIIFMYRISAGQSLATRS